MAADFEFSRTDAVVGSMVMTPPRAPTVIAKVAAIVEAIADADGLIGLSELSRRSGVPKASVHRLCQELVDWGIVERAGDAFRVGSKLFDLGQRAPLRRSLRDCALPSMEVLWATCQHTIHLAVWQNDEVLYLEKIPSPRASPTPSVVAGRVPLHCTATGKCLLAFGPHVLSDQILVRALTKRTPHTIVSSNDLAAALDVIRGRGWAAEHEEFALGFCSVAAPVFDRTGHAVASIAATGVSETFVDVALAELVVQAASETTHRIGGKAPTHHRASGDLT
jgi:DNA-binding IclR family transcriptional regulator